MINYIMNKKNKGNKNISNKLYKIKKNSFSNIHHPKKLNFHFEKSSKNGDGNGISKIISPNDTKKQVMYTKKLLNELFKKRGISPEDTKVRLKNNKTNTNSPIKKINYKRYPSLKKLNPNNNDNIHLFLNNKYNNYICNIKKNIINHNNTLSNNTNITNITNNITTNFTNSINNTVGSITNNNSNNISNKKYIKFKEKQNKEIKINIKILYKDIFYKIELNQFNNGLWLAKKINEYYNIYLSEQQIRRLAYELTKQINNIINCVICYRDVKVFGAVIDINKIIEEYNDKEKRYKIVVKYNKENYYFFINNNKEDINEMVNIIMNNIIKKEKYDSSALRDEIIKKINVSFDRAYNKNQLVTDINYSDNNIF